MPDANLCEKAHKLYNGENLTYAQVGERLDCSGEWARQLVNEHENARAQKEEGRREGIEEAARSMKQALQDRRPDADEYDCGACGADVSYLQATCGNCAEPLNWGAVQ